MCVSIVYACLHECVVTGMKIAEVVGGIAVATTTSNVAAAVVLVTLALAAAAVVTATAVVSMAAAGFSSRCGNHHDNSDCE